ncbi:hypothetical protein ACS0TY_010670 [Phlomoides rotata]
MAIIVLGTLQMLLHELKTETRWSPYDAALALVHNNTCRYVGGSSVGNKKSNIASISTWMKNLGNGEDKFRLIPIRRVPEDLMELRLIQTKRPNEIKKVAKTPEERRKEIEVRVAAARLLQVCNTY